MTRNVHRFAALRLLFIALLFTHTLTLAAPQLEPSDGPPPSEIDVSHVRNPSPQYEPLSPYGNPLFYEVFGQRYYVLETSAGYQQRGYASWYGTKFHGKPTSSREPYDMFAMTAASKTLPIPCYVRVTNLENGRHVVVKVNDRGPFHDDRIIDLSYAAAKKLALLDNGTALVHVEALAPHQYVSPNKRSRHGAPKAQPQYAAAADASTQTIYLQIGAFDRLSNAHDLANEIRRVINKPVKVFQVAYDQGLMYRVKVGPLSNEQEGTSINQRLKAAGMGRGILITT